MDQLQEKIHGVEREKQKKRQEDDISQGGRHHHDHNAKYVEVGHDDTPSPRVQVVQEGMEVEHKRPSFMQKVMGKVGYGDIGKHEVLEGENNQHHGHKQLQQNMAREDVGSRDWNDVSVPGVCVVVEGVEQDVDSSLVDKMKGKIS